MTLQTGWLRKVKYETGTLIDVECQIGEGTVIRKYCNLYNSRIGKHCKIGSFNTIGGAIIGDHCKIEDFTFIPPGVILGDRVFVGPHVCFTNDKYPKAVNRGFTPLLTHVENDVSIGANSTILSGIRIGRNSMIGAGSVIAKDVPPDSLVYGDEARQRGTVH